MSHVDKLLLVSFALVLIVLGADSLSVSNRILAGFGSDCDELKRVRRSTCIEGDCKNGGFCWPTADIFCACPDAYTGKYCTIRINYCATTGPANCQNGATCSNTDTSPWFSCSCAPGFTGSRCETNIDDCASRPCANGRCTDLVNSYSCSCYSGWEGANCNINTNDCPAGACLNGGRCLDGNGTYTCDCSGTGLSGARCETNIDDCASKPCLNGLCTDLVKNYSCSCFTGWEGRNCSVDTDYCLSGPCRNGGVCSDGNSTFNCDCSRVDFQGPTCSEKIDDCASSPCHNGGRCIDGVRSFTCDCSGTGFSGATCETNIDDCASKPCLNGLCTDLVKNYSCSCFTGWEGRNCSVDTDYCLSGPCRNGGVCSDGNLTFSCDCSRTDFQGPNCSSKIDDCATTPCHNGGRCIDGVRSFSCDCSATDFDGPTCLRRIDDCSPNPCSNNASCSDGLRDFSCSCLVGYSGKTCSDELPSFSFGVGGRVSSASFTFASNLSSVHGGDSWKVELQLLTLSRGAFLMLLGDSSSSANTTRLLVTMDATGRILAQLLHNNGSQIAALTSLDSVATGRFVSLKISVSISSRDLTLAVDSFVRSASLSSASTLSPLSGRLIIGGFSGAPAAPAPSLTSPGLRSKRSVPPLSSPILSSLPGNVTAFRGVISSARLNGDRPLILAPVSPDLIGRLPLAVVASESFGVSAGMVAENACEVFSPCENGATCTNVFYNSFSCQCHEGYSDANCSVDYPDCSPNPCKNGDLCLERSDQANYNLRFLPPPFNGSFRFDQATGFVCVKSYDSDESEGSGFMYATLFLSGFVFCSLLATAAVCLLFRLSYISCGNSKSHTSRLNTPNGTSAIAESLDCDEAGPYVTADVVLCTISQGNALHAAAAAATGHTCDSIYEDAGGGYENSGLS